LLLALLLLDVTARAAALGQTTGLRIIWLLATLLVIFLLVVLRSWFACPFVALRSVFAETTEVDATTMLACSSSEDCVAVRLAVVVVIAIRWWLCF
jgi:hypothetical protein